MSKKVILNIFNNISATLINIIAPLIIIPILTSGLGIDMYGVYVTLIAKAILFTVLSEFGFDMYLAKKVSVNRDDMKVVSSLLSIFLVVKFSSYFLILIVLLLFTDHFSFIEMLLAIFVFFQFINITPILSGLESYKFLLKIQLLIKVFSVILVLLIDFSNFGLEKALAIHVSSTAITSVSLFFYFIRNYSFRLTGLSLSQVKEVLKESLPFYGAKLFVNLYQQSSTYLVSFFLTPSLVAIYSISIQLYKVGQAVIGAVAKVLYTSTVKTKDFNLLKKITLFSFLIHFCFLPVVFVFGEEILSLIFIFNVSELVSLSSILYLSLFFTITSSYWGYPALAAIGKENYAHVGILIASVAYFAAFSFIAVFNLTSLYSLIGCIIFSEFIAMVVRVYFAKKFNLL